jgi:hypothetical protein
MSREVGLLLIHSRVIRNEALENRNSTPTTYVGRYDPYSMET